jgi:hypothetical protein
MIIKLTNATPEHKGKELGINTDHIVTAFTDYITREGSTEAEKVTFIFCPPHGTWEVSESIDQIARLSKGSWLK